MQIKATSFGSLEIGDSTACPGGEHATDQRHGRRQRHARTTTADRGRRLRRPRGEYAGPVRDPRRRGARRPPTAPAACSPAATSSRSPSSSGSTRSWNFYSIRLQRRPCSQQPRHLERKGDVRLHGQLRAETPGRTATLTYDVHVGPTSRSQGVIVRLLQTVTHSLPWRRARGHQRRRGGQRLAGPTSADRDRRCDAGADRFEINVDEYTPTEYSASGVLPAATAGPQGLDAARF